MDIQDIREKIKIGDYEISFHAEKERYAEDISINDIESAIANGEILEDYPDDVRGESCLIVGYTDKQVIHIVCGRNSVSAIRIITVYLPKLPKWINATTRRNQWRM